MASIFNVCVALQRFFVCVSSDRKHLHVKKLYCTNYQLTEKINWENYKLTEFSVICNLIFPHKVHLYFVGDLLAIILI